MYEIQNTYVGGTFQSCVFNVLLRVGQKKKKRVGQLEQFEVKIFPVTLCQSNQVFLTLTF